MNWTDCFEYSANVSKLFAYGDDVAYGDYEEPQNLLRSVNIGYFCKRKYVKWALSPCLDDFFWGVC